MPTRYIEAKTCHVWKDVIDDFGASVAKNLGYTPGAPMKEIVRKLVGVPPISRLTI